MRTSATRAASHDSAGNKIALPAARHALLPASPASPAWPVSPFAPSISRTAKPSGAYLPGPILPLLRLPGAARLPPARPDSPHRCHCMSRSATVCHALDARPPPKGDAVLRRVLTKGRWAVPCFGCCSALWLTVRWRWRWQSAAPLQCLPSHSLKLLPVCPCRSPLHTLATVTAAARSALSLRDCLERRLPAAVVRVACGASRLAGPGPRSSPRAPRLATPRASPDRAGQGSLVRRRCTACRAHERPGPGRGFCSLDTRRNSSGPGLCCAAGL